MSEAKAKLTPIERIRRIAERPLAKAVIAGTVIGGVVGGVAPFPQPTSQPEGSRSGQVRETPPLSPSPEVSETPFAKSIPTPSPRAETPSPVPTRTATPNPSPEIVIKEGELSYTKVFHDFFFAAEREKIIKENLGKEIAVVIDRPFVRVLEPKPDRNFKVSGPDGKTYAYLSVASVSDNSQFYVENLPVVLLPEQYNDFIQHGWNLRTRSKTNYIIEDLPQGARLQLKVVNFPRANGEMKPAFMFVSFTPPGA